MAAGALQEWLTQLAVQPGPFWALIFGTPFAGKTTQAQLMARRYGVTATTFDQLLQASPILVHLQAVASANISKLSS